jgi:bacteriochlorophyll 4-vinyl reductase
MDEAPAARLHQALRAEMPEVAPMLAREAGWRTGDYILAHRIPKPAQRLLRLMPARLAAPILARAVKNLRGVGAVPGGLAHAWTFCGSGEFRLVSTWPVVFEIADNPVVRGEHSETPLCHWHAAVFERLFGPARGAARGPASCTPIAAIPVPLSPATNVGETIRLSGWVHRRRDHGGVIFIDLRDHYGITQVLCDPDSPVFAEVEKVRAEYCIRIDGEVKARDPNW